MKAAKAGAAHYADKLDENVFLYTGADEEKNGEEKTEEAEQKDGVSA